MDIFDYVSDCNPEGVADVCAKYGMKKHAVLSSPDIADCVRAVVADENVGQAAFFDLLELHPDKEVIVDIYGKPFNPLDRSVQYRMADGSVTSADAQASKYVQKPMISKTGVAIVAGAVILALAIIIKP